MANYLQQKIQHATQQPIWENKANFEQDSSLNQTSTISAKLSMCLVTLESICNKKTHNVQ